MMLMLGSTMSRRVVSRLSPSLYCFSTDTSSLSSHSNTTTFSCLYEAIQAKKQKVLRRGDLTNLIASARSTDDLALVHETLALYQRKFVDGSEKTFRAYVKTCVDLDAPQNVMEIVAKKTSTTSRLSLFATGQSFKILLGYYGDHPECREDLDTLVGCFGE